MEHCKVDFGSIPWEQPTAGVRFKACELTDFVRVILVEDTDL